MFNWNLVPLELSDRARDIKVPHYFIGASRPLGLSILNPLSSNIFPTFFTVMASKSGNTQTLVISVCKTGLAGCFVPAGFIRTSILREKNKNGGETVTYHRLISTL